MGQANPANGLRGRHVQIEYLSDISGATVPATLSIREAMQLLNTASQPVLFVVDSTQRVVGSLTDGDLRRAMLAGQSLEGAVSLSMKAPPITARAGDDAEILSKLEQLRRLNAATAYLPLLDEQGRISRICHIAEQAGRPVTALVMAGGFGTRLGERTRTTPKPLLPVGGRPMLDRILEQLEEANVGEIHISVHHLADKIADFVAARKNRARIHLLHEKEPLGTAGAIGLLGKGIGDGGLLMLNGDILTRMDFNAFLAFHDRHGHDGTIAVAQHEVRIPFGVVRHGADGLFQGIDEKPALRHFVAAGIYYLSAPMLGLVPEGRPMQMPELLNTARSLGMKLGLFPLHEYWADLGHPEDLDQANQDLAR